MNFFAFYRHEYFRSLEILNILGAPRPLHVRLLTRNIKKNSGSIAFSGEDKFGLHNIGANKIRGSGFSGQRNSGLLFSGLIMFLIFGTKFSRPFGLHIFGLNWATRIFYDSFYHSVTYSSDMESTFA
jgi:hypothetical protein